MQASDTEPPRRTLAPGDVLALTCQSNVAPVHLDERWDEVLRQVRAGEVKDWWLTDGVMRTSGGLEATSQLLAAHFAGQSRQAAAFLQRHGLPAAPVTQPAPPRAQVQSTPKAKPPTLTVGQRWQLLPRPHRPLMVLGLMMAIGSGFFAASLALGNRWGLRLWMVAAVPLCLVLGGGEGAASVLWVGAGLCLCYGWGLVMAFAFRVFRGFTA